MFKTKRSLIVAAAVVILLLIVIAVVVFTGKEEATDNTISFAGSGGYPPFNYLDESGEVIGFDVDVAQEIADRLDMEMEYVTTAWDGIIEGLRARRYDGILGSMAITDEREERVDFSIPYYYSGAQVFVLKDSGIDSVDDLTSSHVIGLVTGTTFEQDATDLGVQAKLYEDDNQTLLELINGRNDGVLTDRVVGLNAAQQMRGGENVTAVGSVLRAEVMGIAFHEDDDELREQVNAALQDMHDDGTLSEISAKWFNGEDITRK
jgi:polar amino acid transport system substrate-binding protein